MSLSSLNFSTHGRKSPFCGEVFKTYGIFKKSLSYSVFFLEPSWKRPGTHLPFSYLRKDLEPLTAQTPSFHRNIRDHLPQMVRQQVISDTPRFRPSLILPMTSLAFAPIGRSARQPSALTSGGWRGPWQQGWLCSRCSAVAMVTMDAECC